MPYEALAVLRGSAVLDRLSVVAG